MTVVVGTPTAYDLTVGVKINMDDVIYTLDPIDTPLYGGIGSDGLAILQSYPTDQIEFQWQHEALLVPRTALAASMTSTQTFITVTAGQRDRFSVGDVIRIVKASAGEEWVRVTALATTADTLDVSRGWGGSTATTFTTSDVVIGVGMVLAEGADPGAAKTKDRSTVSNYTQIFGPYKMAMSRTEQKVAKYGVSNEFNRQLYNRINEIAVAREQAALYGRKYSSATLKMRITGGLDYHITTNVDSTSTQITVTSIVTNLVKCFNKGGLPDVLVANPAAFNDLNDTTNTSIVRVTIDDPRRGRVPVEEVWTEYGPLRVVRHRWVHPYTAFAYKRDGFVRRTFDPLMLERLAKTGDADNVMVVCEEGFEVKGEQHMFKLNNLTAYTAA